MSAPFEALVGHESVKKILMSALDSGKIGHAYIFCGPRGVGKHTAAMCFARAAVGASKNNDPDIITVSNEWSGEVSKSGTILAGTVNKMRSDIYIKPYGGGRKFYIVPDGDTMNAASQNKLLKVFEEPPDYCTIILIAENLNRFLPTILSRATVIRFMPLPIETAAEYLTSRFGISADEAEAKAAISGGRIGAALELIDDPEPERLRKELMNGLLCMTENNNKNMILFSNFLKAEKNGTDFIFSALKSLLDDLVRIKLGLNYTVNKDMEKELAELSKSVTERGAARMLDSAMKYERVYKINKTDKITTDFRVTMFCLACELWEDIHGRNYRSKI